MAFDQQINYKINVDDSGFAAKLSQMRASIDSTMGSSGAGFGGMSPNQFNTMAGMMGNMGGYTGGMMGGFGNQIMPVSYTPPAMAFQPNFGQVAIQQSLMQAGLSTFGPAGIATAQTITAMQQQGVSGLWRGRSDIPNQISLGEYSALSAQNFGSHMGDAAVTGMVTAANLGVGLAAGAGGAALGARFFTSDTFKFIGGSLGSLAAAQAVGAYASEVADYAAQNRGLQNQLAAGSFRSITGGADVDPLTGRGMNREARARTATAIQHMEMEDPRFGMGEYKEILGKGMEMDMFSGSRDADEFKSKFKALVDNVKTVASTLHTSLKEGVEVIRGFRDMGVTDPGQISGMVMKSEIMGRASGRTGMEMTAIGQAGAEIFRGTGITMSKGFELNQLNVSNIRGMLNEGTLSREMIQQAGGENALAQQMTATALSAFQTPMGRGAMMAAFDPRTNTLNMGAIAGQSAYGIAGMAAGNMTPANLMRLQAHQAEAISELTPQQMQLFGLQTDMAQARVLHQASGVGMEDALRIQMQRRGLSEPEIKTNLGLLHTDPAKFREQQQAAASSMMSQAMGEDVRNRFNIGKRVRNKLEKTFVAPVGDALTNASTAVGVAIDNAYMDVAGIPHGETRTMTAETVARGAKLLKESGKSGTGLITDTTAHGWSGLIGGQSGSALGEEFAAAAKPGDTQISMGGMTAQVFKSMEEARRYSNEHGRKDLLIVGKTKEGGLIGVDQASIDKKLDQARGIQATAADRESENKTKLDEKLGQGMLAMGLGGLGHEATFEEVLKGVMGKNTITEKDYKELSDDEFKKKYGKTKGQTTAKIERYMGAFGSKMTGAQKEFDMLKNTGLSVDTLAMGRSELLGDITSKEKQISNAIDDAVYGSKEHGVFGRWKRGMLGTSDVIGKDMLSGKDMSTKEVIAKGGTEFEAKLAEYLKDPSKGGAAMLEAETIASKNHMNVDIKTLFKAVEAGSAESKKKIIETVDKVAIESKRANDLNESATGVKGGTPMTGATIGDISKDAMTQVHKMSDQMEASYTTLISLQRELNSLIDQGSKNVR